MLGVWIAAAYRPVNFRLELGQATGGRKRKLLQREDV